MVGFLEARQGYALGCVDALPVLGAFAYGTPPPERQALYRSVPPDGMSAPHEMARGLQTDRDDRPNARCDARAYLALAGTGVVRGVAALGVQIGQRAPALLQKRLGFGRSACTDRARPLLRQASLSTDPLRETPEPPAPCHTPTNSCSTSGWARSASDVPCHTTRPFSTM